MVPPSDFCAISSFGSNYNNLNIAVKRSNKTVHVLLVIHNKLATVVLLADCPCSDHFLPQTPAIVFSDHVIVG